jgi:Protein of unknown function (DUF1587)/Protein of unknown function (DUF1595)/Planctomycete cytochrome C
MFKLVAFLILAGVSATAADQEAGAVFSQTVQPFLAKNCYACHNQKLKTADLDLSRFKTHASLAGDPEAWEKISARIASGTMPPKGFPRPPQTDVDAVSKWIGSQLEAVELSIKPDPGRVTARRLNRTEYNNTIRDLVGLDLKAADEFPQDDSGYGFDNIGDVLSVSPVLMEKYLKAAERIVQTALFGPEKRKPTVIRFQPPSFEFPLIPKARTEYDVTGLSMPSAIHTTMRFPADGEYQIRAVLEGRRPNGSEPVHIGIWLDGKLAKTLDIDAPTDGQSIDLFGAQKDFRMYVPGGDHWVAASLLRIYEGLPARYGGLNPSTRPAANATIDVTKFMRVPPGATPEEVAALKKKAEERIAKNQVPANRVWVHYIEALGPYNQTAGNVAESRKTIFVCGHPNGPHQPSCERRILAQFAKRALRRPVENSELQPYLNLVAASRKQGSSFDEAIGTGLEAILVSPDFLFRIERDQASPLVQKTAVKAASAEPYKPVSQYALASRLSYFLWSSMRTMRSCAVRSRELCSSRKS